jgi:hypothetical protein
VKHHAPPLRNLGVATGVRTGPVPDARRKPIERPNLGAVAVEPQRPRAPLGVTVVVIVLAIIGALALIRWVVSALFGLLLLGIVIAVLLAIFNAMGRGGRR